MTSRVRSCLIPVFAFLSLMGLIPFGGSDESITVDIRVASHIVQAASAEEAAAIVTGVGGTVSDRLAIIDAVAAELTDSQISAIRRILWRSALRRRMTGTLWRCFQTTATILST